MGGSAEPRFLTSVGADVVGGGECGDGEVEFEAVAALVDRGDIAEGLRRAVRGRLNILVSGGTSTGKTTFLNSLLREIPAHERVVLVADHFAPASDINSATADELDTLPGIGPALTVALLLPVTFKLATSTVPPKVVELAWVLKLYAPLTLLASLVLHDDEGALIFVRVTGPLGLRMNTGGTYDCVLNMLEVPA